MKPETKQLAREMFSTILATAQGLGTLSSEDRSELFKQAAELCFEAAIAFEEVENTK